MVNKHRVMIRIFGILFCLAALGRVVAICIRIITPVQGFPFITVSILILISLTQGIGFLLFKNWARLATLVVSLYSIISHIRYFFLLIRDVLKDIPVDPYFVTTHITVFIAMIFWAFMLYYLTRPKVKELFK